MSFEHSFDEIILIENEYSNNPLDSGGKTKWGITEAVARAFGYQGEMRDLPLTMARDIYKKEYWDKLKLDEVDAVSPLIAKEMFEVGVNSGPRVAATFLQRCLCVLNRNQNDYADSIIDGAMGPATLSALKAFKRVRGDQGILVLNKAMNCLQGSFLIKLAENRSKDEIFLLGWLKHRIAL